MQMDRTPTNSAVSFGDKILIVKFKTSILVSCIDVLTVVNINKLATFFCDKSRPLSAYNVLTVVVGHCPPSTSPVVSHTVTFINNVSNAKKLSNFCIQRAIKAAIRCNLVSIWNCLVVR